MPPCWTATSSWSPRCSGHSGTTSGRDTRGTSRGHEPGFSGPGCRRPDAANRAFWYDTVRAAPAASGAQVSVRRRADGCRVRARRIRGVAGRRAHGGGFAQPGRGSQLTRSAPRRAAQTIHSVGKHGIRPLSVRSDQAWCRLSRSTMTKGAGLAAMSLSLRQALPRREPASGQRPLALRAAVALVTRRSEDSPRAEPGRPRRGDQHGTGDPPSPRASTGPLRRTAHLAAPGTDHPTRPAPAGPASRRGQLGARRARAWQAAHGCRQRSRHGGGRGHRRKAGGVQAGPARHQACRCHLWPGHDRASRDLRGAPC